METVYTTKWDCYSDMIIGSLLVFLFLIPQLAIYGLLPSAPMVSIANIMPHSSMMDTLSPITQGDIVLLTVITGYGAIWGSRLFDAAYRKLRELSAIESKDDPSPTSA
jgi:hypothetical protein